MTITPQARALTETIARAMKEPLAERSIPEIIQAAINEAKEEGIQNEKLATKQRILEEIVKEMRKTTT